MGLHATVKDSDINTSFKTLEYLFGLDSVELTEGSLDQIDEKLELVRRKVSSMD